MTRCLLQYLSAACVPSILVQVLNIFVFSVQSSGLCHCAVLEESYDIF
jgi:hypothetical protein